MKIFRYFLISALSISILFTFTFAAHANLVIWANSGEDKITQDELRANTDSTSVTNSVWDGNKVAIYGAKNEVVSFNVIIEAPNHSASNVSILFNTLSDESGSSISSVSASGDEVFDFTNRNIEIFYVRYLEIKGVSTDIFFSGYGYDERHIPERMRRPWTGDGDGDGTWQDRPDHNKFYPDIAVPMELINSFDITSGQNQSIWVDIYIPKTTPSGLFKGTFTVRENGVAVKQIPVELTIKDFSLPDLPTARTMLAYTKEDINKRYLGISYPESDSTEYQQSLAIIDTHFKVAHRHRISLINGYTETDQMTQEWGPRLSGSLFTAENGYAGPGIGVGNNVYSIGTYSSWPWSEGTQQDMWTNTNKWVDWFDSQAFTTPTDYFLYLIDESLEFTQTEQWAQWMDANTGSGSRLMSLATIGLPDAVNSVPSLDIPTAWVQMAIPDEWQAAADAIKADPDKKLYLYNGGRPGCGTFAIEDEGVSPRVIAWTHYKMKADRWFYWDCTYYNNYQAGMGETNVFQKAQTYGYLDRVDESLGETGWNYLNGDGVLFYPGTDTVYPSESYGVKGPFASLRLKHWRRGLQDCEYLKLATAIDPNQTSTIVDQIIPKVAWEVSVTSIEDPTWAITDISWPTDPDDWEKARKDLADIITQGSTTSSDCKISGVEVTGVPSTSSSANFKASATADSGMVSYRYSIHPDYGTSSYDGLNWSSMTSTEWVSNNAVDYTFPNEGKYIIVVWATATDTQNVNATGIPITGWSVDLSKNNCKTNFTGLTITGNQKVNQSIKFTVNATDSCEQTMYYRFSMHPDYGTSGYDETQWQSMTGSEWISSNSIDYSFMEAGKYIVVVWVTDDTNSVDHNGVPIIGWSVDIE